MQLPFFFLNDFTVFVNSPISFLKIAQREKSAIPNVAANAANACEAKSESILLIPSVEEKAIFILPKTLPESFPPAFPEIQRYDSS